MKKYCKMCGAELNDNNKCSAHILPEFIWRDYMKDEDGHREEVIVVRKGGEPSKFLKKYGITDDGILCRRCDDEILGKYENDFKQIWETVFKYGELHPIKKQDELRGWGKGISEVDDIITIKLFVLTCIWRAVVSTLGDYPITINGRKEEALRRTLLDGKNRKLLHSYSMICSKYEDDNCPLVISPYLERNNKRHFTLIRFCLPFGYMFTVRLGKKSIDSKLGVAEFGALEDGFFIANMGKFEGSRSEERLFDVALNGMRNMYPSDKQHLGRKMLDRYNDISEEDIRKVLY